MRKLIEADALLASLRESRDRANVWLSDCREYGSKMTVRAEQAVMTFNECILRVKGAPTVDAVPVVHCRDCKYWDDFPSSTLAPDHHECKRIRIHTTAEWFCAAGERKDGDHEQDKKS